MSAKEKFLSIVVPVFNEVNNVAILHREIVSALKNDGLKGEIIFVDDGSSDGTREELKKLRPLKAIIFRRNFGQTAAMDAGIKLASGEIIITMDGDLQNDPADISKLLSKMDEGFDVVSGWRKNRQDPFSKRFLSRGADKLRKLLINDGIQDSGCTLKAYKRECFEGIDLYGEMHRFIPAIIKINGFLIGEIEVNHRARVSGQTKYNYKRVLKGFLDMISVWFWRKFSNRPLHLFGGLGFLFSFLGATILLLMAIQRIFYGWALGNRIWPMIGVFLLVMGVQFFISGLLADINIKTFHQVRNEKPYKIKEVIDNYLS